MSDRVISVSHRAQELCESRGGRPGLPVPKNPYGFCGRKATLKRACDRAKELCESRGGFCGRNATLEEEESRAKELCESRGGRPGLSIPA